MPPLPYEDSLVRFEDLGCLSVTSYGAIGDGVVDDAPPIQRALNAIMAENRGGRLIVPGGRKYRLASGLTYNATSGGGLEIYAEGAEIEHVGTDVMLTLGGGVGGAQNIKRGTHVQGGTWVGSASSIAGVRIIDTPRSQLHSMYIRGFTSGAAVELRIVDSWTEQTVIDNCLLSESRHAIDFTPASISGGVGGESFARTRVTNTIIAGGVAGQPLIRCRGGVYDSLFFGLGGNIEAGAHIMHLEGSMGGTYINALGFEGGDATSAGFDVGTFTGTSPIIGTQCDFRNSIQYAIGTDLTPSNIENFRSGIQLQSAATLHGGSGAPSVGVGINGDFYFRTDGGASTRIYYKAAGAWAGIA